MASETKQDTPGIGKARCVHYRLSTNPTWWKERARDGAPPALLSDADQELTLTFDDRDLALRVGEHETLVRLRTGRVVAIDHGSCTYVETTSCTGRWCWCSGCPRSSGDRKRPEGA